MRYGRLAIAYRLWSQAINANQPTSSAMSLYHLALDGAKGSSHVQLPACYDLPRPAVHSQFTLAKLFLGLRPVVRVVQWWNEKVAEARNVHGINTTDRMEDRTK